MKKRSEKKLTLGKVTIQDLQVSLEKDEQKAARGGSVIYPEGPTT